MGVRKMASPTINLNDSLPAAPTDGLNVKWQSVTSVHGSTLLNASAAVVGDGNTGHFLRGDGTWAAPSGGGSSFALTAKRTGQIQSGNAANSPSNAGTLGALGLDLYFCTSSTYQSYNLGNTSPRRGAAWIFKNTTVNELAGLMAYQTAWLVGQNINFMATGYINQSPISDCRMWCGLGCTGSGTALGSTATSMGGSDLPSTLASPATFIGFRFSKSNPSAYASGTTYAQGNMVSYSGSNYISLVSSNIGNTPSTSPTKWALAGNDTYFMCVVSNGTNETITSSGVAGDNLSHIFAFVCNDTAGSVAFYIDGTLVVTISTDYPTAGYSLGHIFGVAYNTAATSYGEIGFGCVQIQSDY
jgi:hypothetical protein